MSIFSQNITPLVAKNRLEDDPNARIVEHRVVGTCTTIHFKLAGRPWFSVFDGERLLGTWHLDDVQSD